MSRHLILLPIILLSGCFLKTPSKSAPNSPPATSNGSSQTSSSSGSTTGTYGVMAALLSDKSAVSLQSLSIGMSLMSAPPTTGLAGVYFGSLGITAYNFRSGQAIQHHPGGTNCGADWSCWSILIGGNVAFLPSEDNVLQVGGQLDFTALNQGYQDDLTEDVDFVDSVGSFSVDFLEVMMVGPGVVYNNELYGGTTVSGKDPLYRYDFWNGITKNEASMTFPGFVPQYQNGQEITSLDHNILFARADWFPSPVLVSFQAVFIDETPTTTIAWSSSPLSDFQKNMLIGFAKENDTVSNFAVVPMQLQTIALSSDSSGTGAANAVVSFDMTKAVNLNSSTFSGDSSTITIGADSSGVPFGLSVNFQERADSGTTNQ